MSRRKGDPIHQNEALELFNMITSKSNHELDSNPGVQQDAAEFFNILLHILMKEKPLKSFSSKLEQTIICNSCNESSFTTQPPEIILALHSIMGPSITLGELLLKFRSSLIEFSCSKKHTHATKRKSMPNPCEYLIIRTERGKSDTLEKSRIELKIPDFFVFDNSYYKIVSIVSHSGMQNSGHYIAHVRDHETKTWYSCNDSFVTQMDDEASREKNCYLLFYEQTEKPIDETTAVENTNFNVDVNAVPNVETPRPEEPTQPMVTDEEEELTPSSPEQPQEPESEKKRDKKDTKKLFKQQAVKNTKMIKNSQNPFVKKKIKKSQPTNDTDPPLQQNVATKTIIVRKFNKKLGGVRMAIPNTMDELLEQGGKKLGIIAKAVRESTELLAEIQDISLLKENEVVYLTTEEEEKEF